MTAALIRMRLTIWRRTPNGMRGVGIALGAVLALATLAIGGGVLGGAESTGDLLALVFAVWLIGWMVGPIQTGGSDFLRPEWFALLPVRPRRLARGLLIASAVGVGPAITVAVLAGLVVFGVRLGPGAAVVAVPAAAIALIGMVLASKVVAEALGGSARSRIATELAALQYGLFLAATIAAWGMLDMAGDLGAQAGGALPDPAAVAVRVIPPGWAVVAVEAAGRGNWLLAAGALAGLAALVWLGLLLWAALLRRRTAGGRVTAARPRARGARRRVLPATPIGAVAGKDVRTWMRDPRRGVEVRVALWAAVFTTAGLWLVMPGVLPFAGVIVTVIGAMSCVNVYAMDGTALWHTLLTPGAERADVRGRQVAWLLIFAPAAVVLSIAGLLASQATWAIPWIAGLVPALLGGAAGLIPMLSVYGLSPETDAHKRSGNPAETGGDATGLYFLTLFATLLPAIPVVIVLGLSVTRDEPRLAWAAVPLGIACGLGYVWGFGWLTYQRLRRRGPELLLLMRVGRQVETADRARSDSADGATGVRARLLQVGRDTCFTLGILALLPQAVVPAVMKILGSGGRSWFAALHVPAPWQWPTVIAMAAAGSALLVAARSMHRAAQPESTKEPAPQRTSVR